MLVNGLSYSWGDIAAMLPTIKGPIPLIGITSIEYSEEQDMENNYGANNFPIAQGLGQFKYAGSIELYKEEIAPIISLAPQGKIQLIPPFPIVCTYGNDTQALKVDTLQSCIFMSNPFAMKSGDKKNVAKFKLLIGNIVWGV